MIKNPFTRKTIAIFFILNFLSTIVPLNSLFAQSAGPNAPEAASFEPVDATDMVNLLTGDFTYVLPLLNVPSPEGGYPLALSYHAGIAMDQESSWVGLGWNLNPGTINRNINGVPDDYKSSLLTEFFWDKEQVIKEYRASIGWSMGVASVGLGLSWGSHRSLGGSVSIGIGVDIGGGNSIGFNATVGTDGSSFGVGVNASGLSFGASLSSNGLSGSVGFDFDKNGSGFSISSGGNVGISVVSKNNKGNLLSTQMNFSSSGVGLSVTSKKYNSTNNRVQSRGGGASFSSFENTASQSDYSTSQSGWSIPLFIPIGLGFLSFSLSKTEYRFSLNKVEKVLNTGPLNFHTIDNGKKKLYAIEEENQNDRECEDYPSRCQPHVEFIQIVDADITEAEIIEILNRYYNGRDYYDDYYLSDITSNEALDIYELNTSFRKKQPFIEGANFPNYDKYNVQAQGMSGAISAKLFENGALFGASGKEDSDGNLLSYLVNAKNKIEDKFRFKKKPVFYFENEISTYLETPVASVDASILSRSTQLDPLSVFNKKQYSGSINSYNRSGNVNRRKTSNYIEYYTNKEILEESTRLKSEGFINSTAKGFDRRNKPSEGIGGFKITAIDGKTYHYSLPVYNHEIVHRVYGNFRDRNGRSRKEEEAYHEKRQMEPFATHWLLTAITGNDYVDTNSNGKVDKLDYGYWIDFNYGLYSEAFVWGNPYGKPFFESNETEFTFRSFRELENRDPEEKNIKTWTRGRKELYYLENIETRTHSAIFVKSQRKDGKSLKFNYGYAKNKSTYEKNVFEIPSQAPLRLDEIILVKGDNDIVSSSNSQSSSYVRVNYPRDGGKNEVARYNSLEYITDVNDNFASLEGRIIKSISLNYDYSLVRRTPNSDVSGRSTLKSVDFKGKHKKGVIPPYRFNYKNRLSFNIEDQDEFGYNKHDNSVWSLEEITTPQGGKIKIDYEPHKVKTVVPHTFTFSNYSFGTYRSTAPVYKNLFDRFNKKIILSTDTNLKIKEGEKVSVNYKGTYPPLNGRGVLSDYNGKGTITKDLGNGSYEVTFDDLMNIDYGGTAIDVGLIEGYFKYYKQWAIENYKKTVVEYEVNNEKVMEIGGSRVKSISSISDNGMEYKTNYAYGKEDDDSGYITYLPFAQKLSRELPLSSELPPSKPMYDLVTTTTSSIDKTRNEVVYGLKTEYAFNVMKERNSRHNHIDYGDFYEFNKRETTPINGSRVINYEIKDNLGAVGQLLSVKTYSNKEQLVSSVVDSYYSMGETPPEKAGVYQESYQTYKSSSTTTRVSKSAVTSTRITYPNLLKNSTELKGGHSYTSEFNDLDPITGQARETYSYSSNGTKFKTRGIQAFREYSEMGSKVDALDNKNMLSQSAGEINYIFKNNEWKEIGASITTWNNDWVYPLRNNTNASSNDAWRKHKTFIWNGGLAPDNTYANFVAFNYGSSATNANWRKVSETTKYNQFSTPLEVKDINDNYLATKMGDNYSKVIATANAAYEDMYYSGAEYIEGSHRYFEGNVLSGSGSGRKENAHTGKYSVQIDSGKKSFEVQVPARTERNTDFKQRFKTSVWVRKGDESRTKFLVNNVQKSFNNAERVYAGDWVQLNGYVTIPTSGTTVAITSTSGAIYADDFRLHPISSSMSSYVYNDWDEVSYIMGVNGLSTHYIYDAAGRLIETQVETIDKIPNPIRPEDKGGFKKVATNSYNYKNN